MDYLKSPKTNSSKVNIRFLVNETLQKGSLIDRKIDGSNTLLHLSVEYDLSDCVQKLLSSGANGGIINGDGFTAKDIAMNNGNQILLQMLGRREDYGKHLQLCESNSNKKSPSKQSKQQFVNSHVGSTGDNKILPLTIGAVYEDYLDWTDSKRCVRLKVCWHVFYTHHGL